MVHDAVLQKEKATHKQFFVQRFLLHHILLRTLLQMSSSAQNQAQESSASKDVNATSATAAAPKPAAISTSPGRYNTLCIIMFASLFFFFSFLSYQKYTVSIDTQAAAPSNNANDNATSSTGNTTHVNTGTTTPAMAAVVAAATAAAAASTDAKNQETDEEAIRNQKLVEEFQYLLEKSQSLFSGLRYLAELRFS